MQFACYAAVVKLKAYIPNEPLLRAARQELAVFVGYAFQIQSTSHRPKPFAAVSGSCSAITLALLCPFCTGSYVIRDVYMFDGSDWR